MSILVVLNGSNGSKLDYAGADADVLGCSDE